MQALHFARNSRYYFFLGCFASGFFGVTSSYIAAQLGFAPSSSTDDLVPLPSLPSASNPSSSFNFFQNCAKCLATVFSYSAFRGDPQGSSWGVFCVVLNLLAGFFIPQPRDPTAGWESAGFKPLPVVRTVKAEV